MKAIERVRRGAEVWFSNGSRTTGTFFLEPASPNREEPQSLSELLNSSRRYLPLEVDAGEVLLIQKNAIVLARSSQCSLTPRTPYSRDIPVRVALLTGETLEGTIAQDLPASHPRISDFLNYSAQFFALRTLGWDCLLNSESVCSVQPMTKEQST
jgi:hypothetical protein